LERAVNDKQFISEHHKETYKPKNMVETFFFLYLRMQREKNNTDKHKINSEDTNWKACKIKAKRMCSKGRHVSRENGGWNLE